MENKKYKLTTGDKVIIGFAIAVGIAYASVMIYGWTRPDPFKQKKND